MQGALQFVNDLLDSDITKLRFWGEKDLDYSVDENGMFYMNSEQEKRHGDSTLNESHFCPYSYFPRVEGLLDDGINAFSMEYQSAEFMKSLKPDIRECFEAYDVQNYVELLGTNEAPGSWYPISILLCRICHAPRQPCIKQSGAAIGCGQLYRIIAPQMPPLCQSKRTPQGLPFKSVRDCDKVPL